MAIVGKSFIKENTGNVLNLEVEWDGLSNKPDGIEMALEIMRSMMRSASDAKLLKESDPIRTVKDFYNNVYLGSLKGITEEGNV